MRPGSLPACLLALPLALSPAMATAEAPAQGWLEAVALDDLATWQSEGIGTVHPEFVFIPDRLALDFDGALVTLVPSMEAAEAERPNISQSFTIAIDPEDRRAMQEQGRAFRAYLHDVEDQSFIVHLLRAVRIELPAHGEEQEGSPTVEITVGTPRRAGAQINLQFVLDARELCAQDAGAALETCDRFAAQITQIAQAEAEPEPAPDADAIAESVAEDVQAGLTEAGQDAAGPDQDAEAADQAADEATAEAPATSETDTDEAGTEADIAEVAPQPVDYWSAQTMRIRLIPQTRDDRNPSLGRALRDCEAQAHVMHGGEQTGTLTLTRDRADLLLDMEALPDATRRAHDPGHEWRHPLGLRDPEASGDLESRLIELQANESGTAEAGRLLIAFTGAGARCRYGGMELDLPALAEPASVAPDDDARRDDDAGGEAQEPAELVIDLPIFSPAPDFTLIHAIGGLTRIGSDESQGSQRTATDVTSNFIASVASVLRSQQFENRYQTARGYLLTRGIGQSELLALQEALPEARDHLPPQDAASRQALRAFMDGITGSFSASEIFDAVAAVQLPPLPGIVREPPAIVGDADLTILVEVTQDGQRLCATESTIRRSTQRGAGMREMRILRIVGVAQNARDLMALGESAELIRLDADFLTCEASTGRVSTIAVSLDTLLQTSSWDSFETSLQRTVENALRN